MGWLSRLWTPQPRVSGPPPSANGASSLHLWWLLPTPGPYEEISAVVEVARAPAVDRLYFWALQVSFTDQGRHLGAAHTGLQWHPGAPAGAVNWGGYQADGGQVLPGTGSVLPPVDGPHTRHLPWSAGRPYRFRIWSPEPGAWRSEVTDLSSDVCWVIRDLLVPATGLEDPVVWAEVFADCDAPPTQARWSDLQAISSAAGTVTAVSARPSYQSAGAGGCSNTRSYAEGRCFVQATGLDKARPNGPDVIALRDGPP